MILKDARKHVAILPDVSRRCTRSGDITAHLHNLTCQVPCFTTIYYSLDKIDCVNLRPLGDGLFLLARRGLVREFMGLLGQNYYFTLVSKFLFISLWIPSLPAFLSPAKKTHFRVDILVVRSGKVWSSPGFVSGGFDTVHSDVAYHAIAIPVRIRIRIRMY